MDWQVALFNATGFSKSGAALFGAAYARLGR
jgi:hypothetical protein